MAYKFFLGDIQLPVAPAKLVTTINNKNETVTLLNEGEVNLLKTPGLTDVEFEFLVPQVNYPFADKADGSAILSSLEQIKTALAPTQFVVSRALSGGTLLFDTDLSVTLESYTVTEDAENGLDLLIAVKLKQYREFGSKKVTLKTDENGKNARFTIENTRPSSKIPKKTYTVQGGDTLWTVGKNALDDTTPETLTKLTKSNNIQNPFSLKPGEVLQIG